MTPLLRTSDDSWLSSNTDICRGSSDDGGQPFVVEGEQSSHMVAALLSAHVIGLERIRRCSIRKILWKKVKIKNPTLKVESVIERAPESARLLVFASNDFVADQTLGFG